MYDGATNSLEKDTLARGQRELATQYLTFAVGELNERGVRLVFHSDFERLVELNKLHRETWPRVSPICNPAYSRLQPDTAFWIECIDEAGETVATNAARLYELGDHSLADELRSLRAFFDAPARYVAAGESVGVTAPSAARIFGRVAWAGALWVRPDYRREGFARILPRVTRSSALARWDAPIYWATIGRQLDALGLTKAYGPWRAEEAIVTHMSTWRGDFDELFLSMDRNTLIGDIYAALEGTSMGVPRWIEMHMANSASFLRRHGINTRS
jgi:GNAT superfamily N-acetyltransferase